MSWPRRLLSRTVKSLLAGGFFALALVLPSAALASGSPGNQGSVSSGSPAGQQYVIPIASARNETSGGNHRHHGHTSGSGSTGGAAGGGGSGGSGGSTLFGAGVSPSSAGTAGAGTAVHSSSRHAPHHRSAHHTNSVTPVGHGPKLASTVKPAPLASVSHPSTGGGDGWLPLVLGGVLVLLLGGGGGLTVRRRLART